jgi:hypothetical protein
MRPQRDQVAGERPVSAEEALDAHGRRDVRCAQQVGEISAGEHEHAQHPVGAVHEREPFLRFEREVERGGHMGERCQVAAASERSELRHLGKRSDEQVE